MERLFTGIGELSSSSPRPSGSIDFSRPALHSLGERGRRNEAFAHSYRHFRSSQLPTSGPPCLTQSAFSIECPTALRALVCEFAEGWHVLTGLDCDRTRSSSRCSGVASVPRAGTSASYLLRHRLGAEYRSKLVVF
jgi:hypothetical protein